jgi:hypothetical protein
MGFSHHKAIGELIFALAICRLDVDMSVIKLSQHASCLAALEHHKAAKAAFTHA